MFITDPDIYAAHLLNTIARLTQYQVRYPVLIEDDVAFDMENEDGCREYLNGFCSCEDCSELVEDDDEAVETAYQAYCADEDAKAEAAYEDYLEEQSHIKHALATSTPQLAKPDAVPQADGDGGMVVEWTDEERNLAWVTYLSSCIGESKPEDCGCGWGDCYICEQ